MVSRLGFNSLLFKANELPSARSAYKIQVDKNTKTAQLQNDKTILSQSVNNVQIAMQGQTQSSQKKMDVVA